MKAFLSLCIISVLGVGTLVAADDAIVEATVTGIRCQACRAEVTRLLSEVPGVANVEISGGEKAGEQKVVIRTSQAISETQAKQALGEASGFEIIAWKAKD